MFDSAVVLVLGFSVSDITGASDIRRCVVWPTAAFVLSDITRVCSLTDVCVINNA